MFGMSNWTRTSPGRNLGIGALLAGGGFRRAAVMGVGMMLYRWWRNRNAGPGVPGGAGRKEIDSL